MGLAANQFTTRLNVWAPWILITCGLLAYANCFPGPFLFDDAVVVTQNPAIFHLWPPWLAVQAPQRFMADYSFALNYRWAGFSPPEYRLVNLLIHLGAGLLLYRVIRRTLLLPRWNDRFAGSATGLAFMTALLWTLHPLQTESVTYIAQRIEALMGFFFLLTFYCFIRSATGTGTTLWASAAVTACALGMGTKEVMVTAPPLLLLYDSLFLSASWKETLKARGRLHFALFSTWLVVAALLVVAVLKARSENVALVGANTVRWEYALTQLNVLAHYLRLSIFPHPLCLDYRWPLVESPLEVIWPGLLTVLLGMGTIGALWRRSWLGFPGAWFFVILAPTSSFNPLPDTAFEHRMYLPLAGVIFLLVIAIHALTRGQHRMRIILACGAGLILGLLTLQRNEAYRSQETMWRDVIQKRPDNYRTYISLSTALITEERYQDAGTLCSNLLARLPAFSQMPYETITNRFVRPGRPPIQLYYGMAHNNLGKIAENQGNPEAAKQHYREAIRVHPQGYWAHRNLGQVLYQEHRTDDAIQEWRETLAWQPRDSDAHCFMGMALSEGGHFAEAAMHYKAALDLKPDLWLARSELAWMLATCPAKEVRNGAAALEVIAPLIRTAGNQSSRALDIIAAAYAESGDYANAVTCASQALHLAKTSPPDKLNAGHSSTEIGQRLELYKAGHPYRQ